MASAMPPLIPNSAIHGEWRITAGQGHGCDVGLDAAAPGSRGPITADAQCLASIGLAGAITWRASSDGIGFAAADGRTLAFFSLQTDGSYLWGDEHRHELRLHRP